MRSRLTVLVVVEALTGTWEGLTTGIRQRFCPKDGGCRGDCAIGYTHQVVLRENCNRSHHHWNSFLWAVSFAQLSCWIEMTCQFTNFFQRARAFNVQCCACEPWEKWNQASKLNATITPSLGTQSFLKSPAGEL